MLTDWIGVDGGARCAQDVAEGRADCDLGGDSALCAGQHLLCKSGDGVSFSHALESTHC